MFCLRSALQWTAGRLAFVGLFLAGPACAQGLDDPLIRDLWQTVQARKILLDDPQLAPLNLGVVVKNRTATLWGPVPSNELAFRAEQRLRNLVEIFEIRNRLIVEPGDDGPAPAAAPAAPQVLPEASPPAVGPARPRPPALQQSRNVFLAGIVTPTETLTARSSPAESTADPAVVPELPPVHVPFLGSLPWPR